MPQIRESNLTLTTVNSNVTIKVSYQAEFSKLERELVKLGLEYFDRIAVIGVDSDSSTDDVLHSFYGTESTTEADITGDVKQSSQNRDILGNITGPTTISCVRSFTVPRSSLQEDKAQGDADEIKCRIRIGTRHMPLEVTPDVFTEPRTLEG